MKIAPAALDGSAVRRWMGKQRQRQRGGYLIPAQGAFSNVQM